MKVGKWITQEDVISPKIFTDVLENVLKKLDWKNKGDRINLEHVPYLRLADDILIFCKRPEELEEMLKDLADVRMNEGLKNAFEEVLR